MHRSALVFQFAIGSASKKDAALQITNWNTNADQYQLLPQYSYLRRTDGSRLSY